MTNSFMQSYPPIGLRGRVTASGALFIYGSAPVGGLLAGALGATVGLRPTVWIMLTTLVASGLFLLCSPIRHTRDLPHATPPPRPRGAGGAAWNQDTISKR